MTDENTPEYESQVIEEAERTPAPTSKTTEDAPEEKKEAPKPTRRESIEASLKKIEEADKAEADPAPKETPKEEVKAEAKSDPVAEKDGAEKPQQAEGDKSSSEDDKSAPPARITEEAKKYWRSTPRVMKSEFARLEGEINRITAESGEAIALHEDLRDMNALAKSHGTTIKAALQGYVNAENALRADFGAGMKNMASAMGKTPEDAIASVLKAYGTTPQQFAQMVMQNPQAFAPRQTLQSDPAIQQLMQSQQQMTQWIQQQEQAKQAQAQHAAIQQKASLVNQWASERPDFPQREAHIAEILKSGIIERMYGKGLSDVQRLETAYKMAGGSGPSVPQAATTAPVTTPASPQVEGNLSISGAPGGGKEPSTRSAKPRSRREVIEASLAKLQA